MHFYLLDACWKGSIPGTRRTTAPKYLIHAADRLVDRLNLRATPKSRVLPDGLALDLAAGRKSKVIITWQVLATSRLARGDVGSWLRGGAASSERPLMRSR
jgi:hypothetical protein